MSLDEWPTLVPACGADLQSGAAMFEGWMLELILPLGVLYILLLALRSILQFIQQWMLNRILRQALESHPDMVPAILAKLGASNGEGRKNALDVGLVAAGVALTIAALLDEGTQQLTLFQFALLPLSIGGALLVHERLRQRRGESA